MKKLLLPLLPLLFYSTGVAQLPAPNPFPKTITVSGSAEMEVIPDEIYVNITLREYQKKGEDKVEIEAIKTAFLNHCKSVAIPDSAISIYSYTGANSYYLRKKKKNPNMMANIVYQVKFTNSKTMDDLVEKLDDEATQGFVIASTSHSKIQEYRKQLKIKAVQAAKEKGIYLTEAIAEKLGSAITIHEPEMPAVQSPYDNIRIRGVSSNSVAGVAYGYRDTAKEMMDEYGIDFKKIKLRFEVTVVFALQ